MAKFNREKVLRQLEFKRKWRSYSRYVYIAVPCVLCCLLCLYFAYSKFFVSEEQAVIRTTVGDFINGDVVIGAYIDGEYSSTIPGKNDGYIVDKIVCDNGASASWDNDSWGIVLTNLSKRTKCNVYFIKPVSKVIAQLDTSGKCPTMNADGSVNVTGAEATNGYLCKAKDAYGDSYYYRGNVTNNYVKFGKWANDTHDVVYGYYNEPSEDEFLEWDFKEYDSMEACQNASDYNKNCTIINRANRAGKDMYWRIIRINGDGTVRVIYDGTSAHANGEASEDRIIGKSAFNSNKNDNAYVGYMYGQTGASTYANTNNSTIKTYIDNWYKTNIAGTTNEQYLADNIFCNDRSMAGNNSETESGSSRTYYRWYNGPWDSGGYNSSMRLICPQKNDAFTVSDTTNGNGALTYPVGLLSTDEIVLAGGWAASNSGYYLYSGQHWWTSSPNAFTYGDARGSYVNSDGGAYYGNNVNYYGGGVRPVFNLKAEVLKYGDGTASNPYRLTESLDNSSSSESGGIDTGD